MILLSHEYPDEHIDRFNRVANYIHYNYGNNFNLDELAEIACLSKFHFHRVFKSITGEALNHFVRRVRLEKAALTVIRSRKHSVTDIAYEYGFSSSQNFSK